MTITPVENTTQLESILPLIDGYQEFYGLEPSRPRNREYFGELLSAKDGQQLMAVLDGQAVGFATLYIVRSSTAARKFVVMNDLFTLPNVRGKGVGRALIRACQNLAHEWGYPSIEWQTQEKNIQAQKLYDRLGAHKSAWFTYHLEAMP